jgi:hypothetical protein
MKPPKFSLRELLWLLLAASLGLGWLRSYWVLSAEVARLQQKADQEEQVALEFGNANRLLQDAIHTAGFGIQYDPAPKLIPTATADAEDGLQVPAFVASDAVVPKFELTRTRQRAAFYAGHWVGGGGHPVNTSPAVGGTTLSLEGQQILLDHDTRQWLEDRAGPRPNTHTETLLVDADIHLEDASGEQSTDPPSSVSFHSVKIDKLHSVKWHTE